MLKNYYLNGVAVIDSGTILNEEFIGSLSNTEKKEFAHQLNRRTEFSVLRNNFVPKQKLDSVVSPVASKIDIVTHPELEKRSVTLLHDAQGNDGMQCEVNGFPINMYINPKLGEPTISLESALQLLRQGAISKDDFAGDPSEVLANASIMDGAVFLIEEIKIGKEYITMIEVKVSHKLEHGFYIDKTSFRQVGKYTIDKENKEIIFE